MGRQMVSKQPLRTWFPAAAPPLSTVLVHFPAVAGLHLSARAANDTTGIHLSTAGARLPRPARDQVLAHEAVHAEQRRRGRRSAARWLVEDEASRLAPDVRAGHSVIPMYRPQSGTVLMETPAEAVAVAAAKKRLALLRRFVDEWTAREARRVHSKLERDPLLEQRRTMDVQAAAPEPPGMRAAEEQRRLTALNRRPLTIELDEDAVTFHVRFHVRFEDAAIAGRSDELKASVREAIKLVWTQRLTGDVFGGRRFTLAPEFADVGASAARDQNFWLITVRPNDHDVATYPGCSLDKTQPGVPTSVTDSLCDGGLMSIPPSHIKRPDVLGHELLHLFGLVDRYIQTTSFPPKKGGKATKPVITLIPTRPTGGRPDPLGGQSGTILREDLGFVFERLGVYAMEEARGLDVLRKLEDAGMGIGGVIAEIERLEDIVRTGRDPRSLLPIRKDFRREVLKSVEDL